MALVQGWASPSSLLVLKSGPQVGLKLPGSGAAAIGLKVPPWQRCLGGEATSVLVPKGLLVWGHTDKYSSSVCLRGSEAWGRRGGSLSLSQSWGRLHVAVAVLKSPDAQVSWNSSLFLQIPNSTALGLLTPLGRSFPVCLWGVPTSSTSGQLWQGKLELALFLGCHPWAPNVRVSKQGGSVQLWAGLLSDPRNSTKGQGRSLQTPRVDS